MSLTAAAKSEIVSQYQRHPQDTGSSEVQVAILTTHINQLSVHLKKHPKDHASRRGLLALVMSRRSLLDYLKSRDLKRYTQLIAELGLRH